MTRKTKIVCAKIGVILAAIPALIWAHEYGPDPGYTAAPGDNATACISSGCHIGTVNSGTGNVKINLPSGNTGTYVPGQAMQILVKITDSTKKAYGFQITARMGSGNLTQAGDFSTTDANTQVLCADGSLKANGKSCPSIFPVEYMEHTLTGYENSISTSTAGSYTYSFTWTPPATASGTITLYAAANCGPGDPPVTSPTNVYKTQIALTPSAAGPTITNVQDAESARTSITSGQWVAIYGSGLSGTSRFWNNGDFTGGTTTGSPLPTSLDGVSVTIGGQAASVYYISGGQLNVLSPSNLTQGPAQVVVNNNGQMSAAFTTTIVQSSPSFFYYAAGGNLYPLAVHLSDGALVGDPAVLANTEKAHPGEILEVFVNGITAAPGGMIVPVTQYPQPVTMSAGSNTLTTSAPYLVAAGEFQVNVTMPASIATGNYVMNMAVPNGSTSTAGVTVTLPVGP
jgi:uncharacterized protein (TIGR03437 family)